MKTLKNLLSSWFEMETTVSSAGPSQWRQEVCTGDVSATEISITLGLPKP
jgi:hypothetical protein